MQVDPSTKLFGVIGDPIRHSMSPLMHNEAFRFMGVNAVYLAFQVIPEMFSSVIQAARTFNIEGFNVTIPYKETIMSGLDDITDEALLCEAVNTVKLENGRAIGYNTDGSGFLASLADESIKPEGMVMVIGAGGAARAIGFQIAKAGCETVLIDIMVDRAESLAQDITRKTGRKCYTTTWDSAGLNDLLAQTDLVINTTPIGMYPNIHNQPPLELNLLKHEAAVCDIIYNPLQTALLEAANRRGLKTVGGLGMFVNQGAQSFKIFTGFEPPVQVMRDVVQRFLQKN